MVNKIGLILGFVGLVLSIFSGVMYFREKKKTRELIEKGTRDLALLEEAHNLKQDSILQEVMRRDSVIKDLAIAQEVSKRTLNESLKEGKRLSLEVRKAKVVRDTVSYYAKCDSLVDRIDTLEAENIVYQSKVETLNKEFRDQIAAKDSSLTERSRLYGVLRQSFVGSTLKNEELKQENRKLNIKLEKSKRTTRLVAVLGVVAAGTIYATTR